VYLPWTVPGTSAQDWNAMEIEHVGPKLSIADFLAGGEGYRIVDDYSQFINMIQYHI
jgi:hypothetical protein